MTEIPDAGAARPGFLSGVATAITVVCVLVALTSLDARNRLYLTIFIWCASALPLHIAAIVRRRRLALFGEATLSITPSPIIAGKEFSGFFAINSGLEIISSDLQIARIDSEGHYGWQSPLLVAGIETVYDRQRVNFKGMIPQEKKETETSSLLNWRIEAKVSTNRGRVGGMYYVNVVRS